MDQLTAYRILGLDPGCTKEELKEAYASLSKLYHPEEYPEKFQEINEAYKAISRAARTSNSSLNTQAHVNSEEDNIFRFQDNEQEFDKDESYDFEATLRRAKEADAQRLHGEILHALAEFKVLTAPAYCKKVKLFKEYFKKPAHQNAFRSPEYIKELSFLVDESKLKKDCYYEIIYFYHLLDKDRNKIIPEAQMLYDALSRKVEMKAQTPAITKLAPFAALPAIIRAFRVSLRGGEIFTAIVVFFLFACACFWIYKKLHNRYSHVVAQIFTLIFTNIFLFFTYALNVWTPIVKNPDTILNIVVYTLLFSVGWIIGLIIFSIIRMIIKAIKK